ncbi:hypothetical protein [Chitinimonas lacunae]|uniref:Porin n=1 Tax=Chitinimonas lacunae TaxID=1963018 RepID=A0ABV8MX02_9NEIS
MMRPAYLSLAVAVALTTAHAAEDRSFAIRGFGTIGAVHSDNDEIDFVTSAMQANGAGHTRSWSGTIDTKLGVQADWNFAPDWTATVQLLSKARYDNSFKPTLEWANVAYQINPEWSVRLGRTAFPAYAISASRNVGYSYVWVRPPVDVYVQVPMTWSDGADLFYRTSFGDYNLLLHANLGWMKVRGGGGSVEVKAGPSTGLIATLEDERFSYRAAYIRNKLTMVNPNVDPLVAGYTRYGDALRDLGFAGPASRAYAARDSLIFDDRPVTFRAVSVSYDDGTWLAQGEYTQRRTSRYGESSLVPDMDSWYLSLGRRFGNWTPYTYYSRQRTTNSLVPPQLDTAVPGPLSAVAGELNGVLQEVILGSSAGSHTMAAGLRWNAFKNTALKLQWERVSLDDAVNNSSFFSFGGRPQQRKADVVSISVDFVF